MLAENALQVAFLRLSDARSLLLKVSDGKFIHKGPFCNGKPGDLGESVLLQIGSVMVVVNDLPSQIHDREQLRIFGLEPEKLNVIVSKAFNHMHADLEPISRGLLYPDAGGIFSFNYQQFPYEHVRRPMWPLDDVDPSPASKPFGRPTPMQPLWSTPIRAGPMNSLLIWLRNLKNSGSP